ncbi:MAG: hypothetical protein SPE01_05675 [Candidatus Spyradocola sp.]|nr:hypothetical protein [Candidatus Spyradocola sp.]
MSQVISMNAHAGWSPEETALLWQEVRACNAGGQPLRVAFDRMAEKTGRKSNSVRNYYYAAVKAGDAPGDVPTGRAAPFTPFTSEEIDELLRSVLTAQGQGVSVRACVASLSGGDRALALRLQNKYRALLKSHPDRVTAMVQTLQQEGLPCVDPYRRLRSLPRQSPGAPAEQLAQHLARRAGGMTERQAQQYLALCLEIADMIAPE